jgi:short-subunit dehydrogenase
LIERIGATAGWWTLLSTTPATALPSAYAETTWDDLRALLRVVAACELAHKLMPGMIERKFSRIVSVASLAGLPKETAGPTPYAASKAFISGLPYACTWRPRAR